MVMENPKCNRVLLKLSGEGLMGKKLGEIAEIQVPAGIIHFEILEIGL